MHSKSCSWPETPFALVVQRRCTDELNALFGEADLASADEPGRAAHAVQGCCSIDTSKDAQNKRKGSFKLDSENCGSYETSNPT